MTQQYIDTRTYLAFEKTKYQMLPLSHCYFGFFFPLVWSAQMDGEKCVEEIYRGTCY